MQNVETNPGQLPPFLGDTRAAQEIALMSSMSRVPLFDEDDLLRRIQQNPEQAEAIEATIPLFGRYANVYPVGIVHLRKFTKQLMGAVAILTRALSLSEPERKALEGAGELVSKMQEKLDSGATLSAAENANVERAQALLSSAEKRQSEAAIQVLGPYVMTTLFELVEDCVTVDYNGKQTKLSKLMELAEAGESHDIPHIEHWVMPKLVTSWIELSFGTENRWRPWVEAVELGLTRMGGKSVSLSGALSAASSALGSLTEKFSTKFATATHTEDSPTQS